MNNPSTIQQLREMKFSAMASELELQLRDPASYAQLSFDDRFGLLVNAEWNRRQANKLAKRIREARMDILSATLEGIEYYEDRGLDRTEMARYASCGYIEEEHHIILKGATGSGKTYLACALGNAACRKFKSVRYVRMLELLDELTIARAENQFRKVTKTYAKTDLLILDEWLMRPLTLQQSYDLFEIIEARTKHGSTIFCTQYDTDGWYDRINTDPTQDGPISDAIMDRIVHNAYVISVEGRVSMRERHGLTAQMKAGWTNEAGQCISPAGNAELFGGSSGRHRTGARGSECVGAARQQPLLQSLSYCRRARPGDAVCSCDAGRE